MLISFAMIGSRSKRRVEMDEKYEALKAKMRKQASEKRSWQELADWIFGVGQEKGAKDQLKMIDILIDDRGGFESLTRIILDHQELGIARFGDRHTSTLSIEQCIVAARAFEKQMSRDESAIRE